MVCTSYVFLLFVQASNGQTETTEMTQMLTWVHVIVEVLKCGNKYVCLSPLCWHFLSWKSFGVWVPLFIEGKKPHPAAWVRVTAVKQLPMDPGGKSHKPAFQSVTGVSLRASRLLGDSPLLCREARLCLGCLLMVTDDEKQSTCKRKQTQLDHRI